VAALAMINMVIVSAAIWLATKIGGSRVLARGDAAAST